MRRLRGVLVALCVCAPLYASAQEGAKASEEEHKAEAEQQLAAASAQLLAEAAVEFKKIEASVKQPDESGRRALEAYLERYAEAHVHIEGIRRPVDVPQVAEVRAALGRIESAPTEAAPSPQAARETPEGYVLIPAGSSLIEPPVSQSVDSAHGEPQLKVKITQAFWMKKAPVTTGEWHAVVGNRPSQLAQKCGDRCPAESVSWFEAVAYANKLSAREGRGQCYTLSGCSGDLGGGRASAAYQCDTVNLNKSCTGYRLPTEAEWAYAYQTGTTGRYDGPIFDIVSSLESEARKILPVGTDLTDNWGLHHMSGNGWEWVWGWFGGHYHVLSPQDGLNEPTLAAYRVLRGGSWDNYPRLAHAADRGSDESSGHGFHHTFRLVRTSP